MVAARFFHIATFGGFDESSPWANETWQYGFSAVANTDTSLPTRDVVKAPCPNTQVEASTQISISGGFQWNFGFDGGAGNAMSTAFQNSIGVATKTFFDGVRPYMGSDQRMEGVKITAYQVGPNGQPKVINGSTMGFLQTPVFGSSANFRLPPQCASVISAQSGARGPGGRGRSYIPMTGATLTVDGEIGSTERTALLTAVNAYGQSLAGTSKILLAVVNRNAFTYSGIAQWRVGNHVDIQRRRANAVRETYDVVNALF